MIEIYWCECAVYMCVIYFNNDGTDENSLVIPYLHRNKQEAALFLNRIKHTYTHTHNQDVDDRISAFKDFLFSMRFFKKIQTQLTHYYCI